MHWTCGLWRLSIDMVWEFWMLGPFLWLNVWPMLKDNLHQGRHSRAQPRFHYSESKPPEAQWLVVYMPAPLNAGSCGIFERHPMLFPWLFEGE